MYTEGLTAASNWNVFWLYLLGYIFITILLVLILWVFINSNSSDNLLTLGAKALPSLKFAIVLIFASMSGIPPFFFFFCKLSVISFLVNSNSWGVVLSLLLILFLGWYAYYNLITKTLSLSSLYKNYSYKSDKMTSIKGLTIATICCLTLGGFFFFDDLIILTLWIGA